MLIIISVIIIYLIIDLYFHVYYYDIETIETLCIIILVLFLLWWSLPRLENLIHDITYHWSRINLLYESSSSPNSKINLDDIWENKVDRKESRKGTFVLHGNKILFIPEKDKEKSI